MNPVFFISAFIQLDGHLSHHHLCGADRARRRRSDNKIPAIPFVIRSVFLGAFALLLYMALWKAPCEPPQLPPSKEELEGLE